LAERFFAHTRPGAPEAEWEPLDEHLRKVANLAARFAEPFGGQDWARLAALWHDLGKYRRAFQDYLRAAGNQTEQASEEAAPGRVDHSTAGAIHAAETTGPPGGNVLAYLIAGHHAGLPDGVGGEASLEARLSRVAVLSDLDRDAIPADIFAAPKPTGPPPSKNAREIHLWIRILFSCLVDADYLATEIFVDPDRAGERLACPAPASFIPRFEAHMRRAFPRADSAVNRVRAEILRACVSAAALPPGLFSLTVPTGGGKTLSSLAFALHHADRWNKRRIVYAIPYTSIIEQTADVFREILGEWVVEHHSNLDPEDPVRAKRGSRLAAENWDAPVVVTTNVQFFESLFAARTSRCRKLHNLVDSIVILDEAQLLPPEYLEPILQVIRALSRNYGVTFVLSTATQPALALEGVHEIAPDPGRLSDQLRRVRYEWPQDSLARSWEQIAVEMRSLDQVLCIVNRRDDARALVSLLPEDAIHLSALMCGDHRSQVIAEIKSHLGAGRQVRVVSTQLVEAGVDIDFPVVFRAFAGLDSIAQAAGRCNREGRLLPQLGRVVVFLPPTPPPPGLLRKAADAAAELLFQDMPEDLRPEIFTRYFDLLYHARVNSLDARGILDLLGKDAHRLYIQFRQAAASFRLVDESGYRPVLVMWGEGRAIREEIRWRGPSRELRRRAQRYVVNVPLWQLDPLVRAGSVSELEQEPGVFAQWNDRLYDRKLGLLVSEPEFQPETLIVEAKK
jgi:CRISPR-associated endonuclease/helicase Cas3